MSITITATKRKVSRVASGMTTYFIKGTADDKVTIVGYSGSQ